MECRLPRLCTHAATAAGVICHGAAATIGPFWCRVLATCITVEPKLEGRAGILSPVVTGVPWLLLVSTGYYWSLLVTTGHY